MKSDYKYRDSLNSMRMIKTKNLFNCSNRI